MVHDPLACDDLIAHRRYAFGRGAADDGDWAVAAEIFEQAAEQAPGWAPAWFALGEARQKLGDIEGAAKAFRATLAADPSDAQGAAARFALLGQDSAPDSLSEAYVTRLFDDYAPRFDAHLTENLGYRGPALIAQALSEVASGRRFANALDLGCGTGLMGGAIHDRVDRLTGVDLSPAMVARARERSLYDVLEIGDAIAFLNRQPPAVFDLVVSADALCYFGDLRPMFAACARAVARAGLFVFSIETFEGDGFRLHETMRFAHARSYIETVSREAGFRPLLARSASTRREAAGEAPGLICVLETAPRP